MFFVVFIDLERQVFCLDTQKWDQNHVIHLKKIFDGLG